MKNSINFKHNSVPLYLCYELLGHLGRKPYLAAYQFHIGKFGFCIDCREGLNVLISNEVLAEGESKGDVAEVDIHLLVRIREVGENRQVRIEEGAHVEVGGVEARV